MKTIPANKTLRITARELFSMTYGTREQYSSKKIDVIKMKIPHTKKLEYFESDGVIFYTTLDLDRKITRINNLKDYTLHSSEELWKFGFVDRETHEITLLFGGHSVGRDTQALEYFEITKAVVRARFPNYKNLVPFAFKD
jgi:hypothetical protein